MTAHRKHYFQCLEHRFRLIHQLKQDISKLTRTIGSIFKIINSSTAKVYDLKTIHADTNVINAKTLPNSLQCGNHETEWTIQTYHSGVSNITLISTLLEHCGTVIECTRTKYSIECTELMLKIRRHQVYWIFQRQFRKHNQPIIDTIEISSSQLQIEIAITWIFY